MSGEDNEIFIDADQNYGRQENTYEQLIIRQIQRCVDNLSKEVTGGRIKYTQKGTEYEEDVRDLIINSVDTLEGMMYPFLRTFESEVKKKHEKIDEHYKKISETEVEIKGKGKIKIKNLKRIPADSPFLIKFKEFKADTYREIFKLLVKAYQKSKSDIEALSHE